MGPGNILRVSAFCFVIWTITSASHHDGDKNQLPRTFDVKIIREKRQFGEDDGGSRATETTAKTTTTAPPPPPSSSTSAATQAATSVATATSSTSGAVETTVTPSNTTENGRDSAMLSCASRSLTLLIACAATVIYRYIY